MRVLAIASAAALTTSCVEWTGVSRLKFEDETRFAGTVDANPGFVMLLFPGDPAGPWRFDVSNCFETHNRGESRAFDLVPTVGPDGVKRVCRQYEGVDLLTYPIEAKKCFKQIGDGDTAQFQHPWLDDGQSDVCRSLVEDIRGHRSPSSPDGKS